MIRQTGITKSLSRRAKKRARLSLALGDLSITMRGIFGLNSPADLRAKLKRDLARLKSEPLNSDAAFNFFVTAEHMLDWVYPKGTNRQKRTVARKNSVLLEICSHLANGAKHFEVEDPRHKSVSSTETSGGFFQASFFAPAFFPNAYFGAGRRLVVALDGEAKKQLGPVIGLVDLAEKIMQYWESHPDVLQSPNITLHRTSKNGPPVS